MLYVIPFLDINFSLILLFKNLIITWFNWQELKNKLEALDAEVAGARDRLAQTKKQRDKLRVENVQLRTNCGLLGHDELLRDMELVVDDHAAERSRLERLQLEHAELSLLSGSLQKKIEQVSAAASVAVPGATAALPGTGMGRDGLLPPLALTPGPAQASSRGGGYAQMDKSFALPKLWAKKQLYSSVYYKFVVMFI